MFDLLQHPHRRFNPLTGEWVLVSPHRTQRPWQGQVEKTPPETRPTYDPECYLCPGNPRAGGAQNPAYESTFVFQNDFAALMPNTPDGEFRLGDLLLAEAESGLCRVICFSPDHSLTVAKMAVGDIRKVVDVWAKQHEELAAKPDIRSVQIFENRGEMMGCSNPHPHCQVWASETLPNEARKELSAQTLYLAKHKSCLLCDYLKIEQELRSRIVCENHAFVAVVPFWAVWPFETMLLSKRHFGAMPAMSESERDALADIMKQLTVRYDALFDISFPYTMGFHQSPTDGGEHVEWHFHAHYYPPLLRSATVKKFMVGYEMLATPQRDITAEAAAARLREVDS